MKDFMKVFSKKRTNSEYLKYEDGEIITIEKVTGPDNTPRLDLNDKSYAQNEAQASPLNKPGNYENRNIRNNEEEAQRKKPFNILKNILGVILLIVLLGFAINITLSFINKTKNYVDNNGTNGVTQEVNGEVTETPTINDNNQSSGTIGGEHNVVIKNPIDYKELETILRITGETNKSILTIINDEKSDVVLYLDSKTNPYVIKSKINKQIIEVQNIYRNIQQYKSLFDKYNAQNLYLVELKRLENILTLLNNLSNVEGKSDMANILNEHIKTDNTLIDSQLSEFKAILNDNYIDYTVESGKLSWVIKEK